MARYKKRFSKDRSKTRYGKQFKTRKGKIGRYKYVGNRRVSFVEKERTYRRKSNYSRGRRY